MNLPGIPGVFLTGPCFAICSNTSSLVYLILKCLVSSSFSSPHPRQKYPQSACRPESNKYGAVMMAINRKGSLVVLSNFGGLEFVRSWITARRSKSRSRFRARLPPLLVHAAQYWPGRLRILGGFATRRCWRLVMALLEAKKLDARPIVRGKNSRCRVKQK